MDLGPLQKGLNSLLPSDIVIKHLSEADIDFHARYCALSRVYKYLIWNSDTSSPFYRRFSWHICRSLDREKMQEAAQCLMGWHDFSSFQGANSSMISSEREILRFAIRGRTNGWVVTTVEANAFLKHLVRNIMGTLCEVGKGLMTVGEFKDILEAADRRRAGITAPAQGLFLKEVKY